MSKFKFICEEADYYSSKSIRTTEFSAVLLEDILKEFEYFLRGAGFHFEGNVVIDQETWPVDEANMKFDEYRLSESEDAN
jgi:hypothetical protein